VDQTIENNKRSVHEKKKKKKNQKKKKNHPIKRNFITGKPNIEKQEHASSMHNRLNPNPKSRKRLKK